MPVTRAANLVFDSLLALVYPQSCAVCGGCVESRDLGVACANCWQETRIFTGDEVLCWKCGLLSSGTVRQDQREQVRCRRCDDDSYTAARACGAYDGALRASILALKREPYICRRLVDLLVQAQNQLPLRQATRIVPVALHPAREKARGFNQAKLIAEKLSFATSILLADVSLIRTSHTERHRAGMDVKDRSKTVENAFAVRHPALINGEKVLLVDDVFTTGATVSSCAQVLLEAGAADVYVLTIARPIFT